MALESDDIYSARVLIVDDTEFNRILIEETLRSAGYTHFENAENGLEALDKVESYHPDVIILDLMMPVMDGFEFCEKLRLMEAHADTPIITQTAMSDADQRLRVFKLGADDLLLKPIHPNELIARVKLHLERRYALKTLTAYQAKIQKELDLARDMQRQLMPTSDKVFMAEQDYDLTISGYFVPSLEVSGDLWGFMPISAHELAIYNCDFSGHGVSSAINTFRFHTLLQEYAYKDDDPGSYLRLLNTKLHTMLPVGQFATLFYGVINIAHNKLRYATAGCPSPILFRPHDASYQFIDGRGLPLGITDDATYETQQTDMHAGDMLLLFSDALIETKYGENAVMLSEEDIAKICCEDIASQRFDHTFDRIHQQRIIQKLLHTLEATANTSFDDDLTISFYTRNPDDATTPPTD